MNRNRTLDVIKGLLCLIVISTHFDWSLREHQLLLFGFWMDLSIPPFMIISGYVGALSARRNGDTLRAQYAPAVLCGKLLRFLVPFTAFFLAEQLIYRFHAGMRFGACELLRQYLTGGVGQGSYYTPMMLQFVLVFPLIDAVIRRYDFKGLLLCGAAHALYEVLKWACGMDLACYRLLVFRYLLPIAFGSFLARSKTRIKPWLSLASFCVGVAFVIAYHYLGYEPVILNMWTSTSLPVCLYVMPVVGLVIRRCTLRCRPLERMGRATYNIYLIQMLYYCFAAEFVYLHISSRPLQLAVTLVVCVSVGLVFHLAEEPVTKRLRKLVSGRIGQRNA